MIWMGTRGIAYVCRLPCQPTTFEIAASILMAGEMYACLRYEYLPRAGYFSSLPSCERHYSLSLSALSFRCMVERMRHIIPFEYSTADAHSEQTMQVLIAMHAADNTSMPCAHRCASCKHSCCSPKYERRPVMLILPAMPSEMSSPCCPSPTVLDAHGCAKSHVLFRYHDERFFGDEAYPCAPCWL